MSGGLEWECFSRQGDCFTLRAEIHGQTTFRTASAMLKSHSLETQTLIREMKEACLTEASIRRHCYCTWPGFVVTTAPSRPWNSFFIVFIGSELECSLGIKS